MVLEQNFFCFRTWLCRRSGHLWLQSLWFLYSRNALPTNTSGSLLQSGILCCLELTLFDRHCAILRLAGVRICFACCTTGTDLIKCSDADCGHFYHSACLVGLVGTVKSPSKAYLRCPLHHCHTCDRLGREPKSKDWNRNHLAECTTCPIAYHFHSMCFPAECEVNPENPRRMICADHREVAEKPKSARKSRGGGEDGGPVRRKLVPTICFTCKKGKNKGSDCSPYTHCHSSSLIDWFWGILRLTLTVTLCHWLIDWFWGIVRFILTVTLCHWLIDWFWWTVRFILIVTLYHRSIDWLILMDCSLSFFVGGKLLLCDTCPFSSHVGCAGLDQLPEGPWKCADCVKGAKPMILDIVWYKQVGHRSVHSLADIFCWLNLKVPWFDVICRTWPCQIVPEQICSVRVRNARPPGAVFPLRYLGTQEYVWAASRDVLPYEICDPMWKRNPKEANFADGMWHDTKALV